MLPRSKRHPQDPEFIQEMFGKVAPRYDLANHVLSLGLDYGWRRKIGREMAVFQPKLILDLATGSGDLALTLKKYCPAAKIVAADFCVPMLEQAQRKNVENLVAADGMRLPFGDGTFDLVTVSFGLRNMASYSEAIREFLRVLKADGRLLILDFSMPENVFRAPYRFYLRSILPTLASFLTHEKCAYDYLGESIEAFPRGGTMTDLIVKAGSENVTAETLALGIVSLYRANGIRR